MTERRPLVNVAGGIQELPAGDTLPGRLSARKTADTARTNTTTVTADPHLALTLEASGLYVVELVAFVTGSQGGDVKGQFTGPASATGSFAVLGMSTAITTTTATAILNQVGANVGLATSVASGNISTTQAAMFIWKGLVVVSSTAGALAFLWAQNTIDAVNATTLKAGSHLTAHKL